MEKEFKKMNDKKAQKIMKESLKKWGLKR